VFYEIDEYTPERFSNNTPKFISKVLLQGLLGLTLIFHLINNENHSYSATMAMKTSSVDHLIHDHILAKHKRVTILGSENNIS
jgi:hypothetical protein